MKKSVVGGSNPARLFEPDFEVKSGVTGRLLDSLCFDAATDLPIVLLKDLAVVEDSCYTIQSSCAIFVARTAQFETTAIAERIALVIEVGNCVGDCIVRHIV